jgi:hypothetical protein
MISPLAVFRDSPVVEEYTPPVKSPVPTKETLCTVASEEQNGLVAYEIEAVGGLQLLAVQEVEALAKQVPGPPVGVRVIVTLSLGFKPDTE